MRSLLGELPLWVVVLRKELLDIVRDRRSVIISLLLPLILFPSLFYTLRDYRLVGGVEDGVINVQFTGRNTEEAQSLAALLKADERIVLSSQPPADVQLSLNEDSRVELRYDNTDRSSISASHYVRQILSARSPQPQEESSSAAETTVILLPKYERATARGRLFLSLVLPFMLFMFACTCPLPITADLSAGEKERGSLEPLLSTGIDRTGIIAGKLSAAAIAGFLSVCAFSLGVYISYRLSPSVVGDEPMNFLLPKLHYLFLFVLSLLLTIFYAAVELAAGIFTRSTKEAQLLGMPLLILSMACVYLAQSLDASTSSSYYYHLPLINIALVIREIAVGALNSHNLFVVGFWMLLYILTASIVAWWIFCRETAVFRQ
jgi:sodium transport system permease protein